MILVLNSLYTLLQKVSFGTGKPDGEETSLVNRLWQESSEMTLAENRTVLEEGRLHLCLPLLGTSRSIRLIDILLGGIRTLGVDGDLPLVAEEEEAISTLSKFLSSIMKEAKEALSADKKKRGGKKSKPTGYRGKKPRKGLSGLEAVYFHLLQEGFSRALKLLYLTPPKEGKLIGEFLSPREDKPEEISIYPDFGLYLYPLELAGWGSKEAPLFYVNASSESLGKSCLVIIDIDNKMALFLRVTPIEISVKRSLKLYP